MSQPAQRIYDRILVESEYRDDNYPAKLRLGVWQEAMDYALEKCLNPLSLEEVIRSERVALGHTDYAAKWAYRVAELLSEKARGK